MFYKCSSIVCALLWLSSHCVNTWDTVCIITSLSTVGWLRILYFQLETLPMIVLRVNFQRILHLSIHTMFNSHIAERNDQLMEMILPSSVVWLETIRFYWLFYELVWVTEFLVLFFLRFRDSQCVRVTIKKKRKKESEQRDNIENFSTKRMKSKSYVENL